VPNRNCRVVPPPPERADTTPRPDFARAPSGLQERMSTFLSHGLVPIAIGAVAVVLLLGLINMMRGGSGNTSQKLMRLRVLLQFIAIVVIMFTIWVISK
jgi:Hypoxia induced protein conserved region